MGLAVGLIWLAKMETCWASKIPRNPKDERRETNNSTIFHFMLDGKKVYKSTLVCPLGILMG